MAQTMYCWKCKGERPMLSDEEAVQVNTLLQAVDAHEKAQALPLYEKITGYRETSVEALQHHMVSNFGPPCPNCGKPLRAPSAKVCAECWQRVR